MRVCVSLILIRRARSGTTSRVCVGFCKRTYEACTSFWRYLLFDLRLGSMCVYVCVKVCERVLNNLNCVNVFENVWVCVGVRGVGGGWWGW